MHGSEIVAQVHPMDGVGTQLGEMVWRPANCIACALDSRPNFPKCRSLQRADTLVQTEFSHTCHDGACGLVPMDRMKRAMISGPNVTPRRKSPATTTTIAAGAGTVHPSTSRRSHVTEDDRGPASKNRESAYRPSAAVTTMRPASLRIVALVSRVASSCSIARIALEFFSIARPMRIRSVADRLL